MCISINFEYQNLTVVTIHELSENNHAKYVGNTIYIRIWRLKKIIATWALCKNLM